MSGAAQTPAERAMRDGVEAFTRGEFATAQEAFIRAVKADPENGRAWLGLADASRRVGAIIAAEEALEKAVARAFDDPEMHRGLAIYHAETEEFERAADHLSQYVRLLGPSARAADFAEVSGLYLDAGMATAAEQFARSGLERGGDTNSMAALGEALALGGRADDAAEALSAAIKKDPFDEHRHWLLARLFLEQRRYPEASAALSDGLRYFDKSALLSFGQGLARLGQDEPEAAVNAFLAAAQREPQSAWLHAPLAELAPVSAARANIELRLRTHEQQALEEPPNDWRAALELGQALEARGESEQSLAAYERAVKAQPREPAPHYRLGRLAARMGREEQSRRELELHARLAAQQPLQGLIERLLAAAPGRRLLPKGN